MKKKILVVSHARDNRDAGSSRVVHLIKEALDSDLIEVDLQHNEMDPASRGTRLLGRLALPAMMSRQVRNVENYDVVFGCNGTIYPLFEKLRAQARRPLLINYVHGLSTFDEIATLREAEVGLHSYNWHYRLITGPLTRRLPEKWEWRGACLADASIVHNSIDREFLRRKGIGNVNQVDLPLIPEIAAAAQRATTAGRDPRKLLWFGSWTARKGVNYLADAFAQVLEQVPDAMLTMGGTDRPEGEILAHFPVHARARIRVLGRIPVGQQIEEFAGHAIFLFPSLSEGYGFALLEAMSMGMAAVATLTGFAADHLTPEKHFVAVPMASTGRFAADVVRLVRDDARRVRIAADGRDLALGFTLARYGRRLREIIDAAALDRRPE
jgi:glycosyltransferase involved in cell wall biosynthesis